MALEASGPKIYNTMQLGGEMQKIAANDVISMLQPIEHGLGYRWEHGTNKLSRMGNKTFHMYQTPWCHASNSINKHCGLDHQVLFNLFNIIHPRCMNCWKTVVTPKSFDELMTWKKVQENEIEFACKCGIELRDYTPKHYGAYHYGNSLEDGRFQYEQVVQLAKKHLSEETVAGILLKRGCTEYEMIKGPSSHWHVTDREQHIIEMVEAYVDIPFSVTNQAEFIKTHVMMRWLLYAHMIGDFSYMPYNGDQKLFPGYQVYHKGSIQALKHDLAICHAEAKDKLSPELTEEFIMKADQFAEQNGITLDRFNGALGNPFRTPSGKMDFKELRVAKELVGEEDGNELGEDNA